MLMHVWQSGGLVLCEYSRGLMTYMANVLSHTANCLGFRTLQVETNSSNCRLTGAGWKSNHVRSPDENTVRTWSWLIPDTPRLMEAPSYWVMALARALQGISSSVVWIVALALLYVFD